MVSPETREKYTYEKEIIKFLDEAIAEAKDCNLYSAISRLTRAEVERSHEYRFMDHLVKEGLLSEADQRDLHEEHLSQLDGTQEKVVRILEEKCGCKKWL